MNLQQRVFFLSKRRKIIIAHSFFGRGGAEVSIMWLLEALKTDYAVNLLTRGGFNLNELNEISGTSIRTDEIQIIEKSNILYRTRFGHAFFLRFCRSIGNQFDMRITGSRTLNWGMTAVHFLSDVAWNSTLINRFCENEEKRGNTRSLMVAILDFIRTKIVGRSKWDIANDYFVANSYWTSSVSREFLSHAPKVIYPSVCSSSTQTKWSSKQNRFICLGRISPEKKIEVIIDILARVRQKGYDIQLHIIGKFTDTPYSRFIGELCQKNRSWITLTGELTGIKKDQYLEQSKFGINGCQREAFGISTAEMVKAGMLPFIPSQGAQKEVVPLEELTFDSSDDAVNKIIEVLINVQLQENLISRLNELSPDFSSNRFCTEVRSMVKNVLIDSPENDG